MSTHITRTTPIILLTHLTVPCAARRQCVTPSNPHSNAQTKISCILISQISRCICLAYRGRQLLSYAEVAGCDVRNPYGMTCRQSGAEHDTMQPELAFPIPASCVKYWNACHLQLNTHVIDSIMDKVFPEQGRCRLFQL